MSLMHETTSMHCRMSDVLIGYILVLFQVTITLGTLGAAVINTNV